MMEQINKFPASQNQDFPQRNPNTQNQTQNLTQLELELENSSSFCSTCYGSKSNKGELENGSLASLQNYSLFRRNVEFASSRVKIGERSRSHVDVGVDGNPVLQQLQLDPIVEESFCSSCCGCGCDLDMTLINEGSLRPSALVPGPPLPPRNFNFNPLGNSVVASVDGYSEFEGNSRIESSRLSQGQGEIYTQTSLGETTPTLSQNHVTQLDNKLRISHDDETQVDVDDNDDERSLSDCDCSSCCGSESELTFIAPQPQPQQRDVSLGLRSMTRSRVARGWGGSMAEFPPSDGADLDSSRLSTYSGFTRGLLQNPNCDDLNSSFIPPQSRQQASKKSKNTPNPLLPSNAITTTKPTNLHSIRKVRKCQRVGPFCCKICSKPFKYNCNSKTHEYTHMTWTELENSGVFHQKCAPCGKIFLQSRDYKEHLDMHAGRKRHKCLHPNCHKSFTHQSVLAVHKRTHLSERGRGKLRQGWKHECYFCANKFPNPSFLHIHLVVHTREKPFRCDHTHKGSKCSSSFTQNGHLKQHKRLHLENGGREFTCGICNKMFKNKSSLNCHVKTVHEKKRDFKCPEEGCGKEFGTNGDLKKHRKTVHLGLKPHKCPHSTCNKAFCNKGNLSQHLKRIHK